MHKITAPIHEQANQATYVLPFLSNLYIKYELYSPPSTQQVVLWVTFIFNSAQACVKMYTAKLV